MHTPNGSSPDTFDRVSWRLSTGNAILVSECADRFFANSNLRSDKNAPRRRSSHEKINEETGRLHGEMKNDEELHSQVRRDGGCVCKSKSLLADRSARFLPSGISPRSNTFLRREPRGGDGKRAVGNLEDKGQG